MKASNTWNGLNQGRRQLYELCKSGVEYYPLDRLGIDWNELEISGENYYGYPPLQSAIADRYGISSENVVSTMGASFALYLVCASFLDAGDLVLVEKPAYEPLWAVPGTFQARIERVERHYEQDFRADLQTLEKQLDRKPKLFIMTNLHNPSGTLLESDDLDAVVKLTEERSIPLVMDEIYLDFMDERKRLGAFQRGRHVIVIGSLTKVYGMGDLRCGWILAPAEWAAGMRKIIDSMYVEAPFLIDQIALRAFKLLDGIRNGHRSRTARNLAVIREFIRKEPKLSWVEPRGGVVCFPRIEAGVYGDELADILRREYNTAVVPGSFFDAPRHIRIGFGGPPEVIEGGIRNIGKALATLLYAVDAG